MKIHTRLVIALNLVLCLNAAAHGGQFADLIAQAAKSTHPNPSPAPGPTPGSTCDNCNGKGRLGDGTVSVDCPVCEDGKIVAVPSTILPMDSFSADNLPADSQPTPMAGVTAGLNALNLRKGERIVDYGCGFDARWLITACRRDATITGVGVEIEPALADSARRYVAAAGLSDRIEIITGDATEVDVQADVGVAYLFTYTLAGLVPKIQKLDRFVSFAHPVPGLSGRQIGDFYLYERVQPMQLVRPSAATWKGRTYTGPVCNRANCTMCNAIRQQLATQYVPAAAPARSGHYETRCTFNRFGRKTGCHSVWVED